MSGALPRNAVVGAAQFRAVKNRRECFFGVARGLPPKRFTLSGFRDTTEPMSVPGQEWQIVQSQLDLDDSLP